MYKIGDKVAHPIHGAGLIEEIVEREVNGHVNEYFVMKIAFNSMTVLVPCSNTEGVGLRPIVSADKADKVLKAIPDLEIEICDNWNRRYREYVAGIKSGDLMQVSAVLKSLLKRNKEKEKGLSTGERKLLSSAKQIVVSEIMMAKNITYEEADKEVMTVFESCGVI